MDRKKKKKQCKDWALENPINTGQRDSSEVSKYEQKEWEKWKGRGDILEVKKKKWFEQESSKMNLNMWCWFQKGLFLLFKASLVEWWEVKSDIWSLHVTCEREWGGCLVWCVQHAEAASVCFLGFKHECSTGENKSQRSSKWRIKVFFELWLTLIV